MHRVPYKTFLKWNAAGGVIFSSIVIVLGYEFANSLQSLEKYLKYWAILFLLTIFIVVSILKRRFEQSIAND
jgi:hypothetical protein